MKKRGERLFACAMAGMLLMGSMAGCGSASSSSGEAAKGSTVSSAAEASTAPASAAESEAASSAAQSSAAESSSAPESSAAESAAAPSEAPAGFNYEPLENTDGKEIRIATLTVSNNPFWNTVVEGIAAAEEYLAGQNVTVDVIEFDDFDGQAFADAIDTCIVKDYDAITTVGVADTIVPAIDKATAAGIPVYTFNSDTEKESTRVAFVGQDLYAAGGVAAQKLAELMGDSGKVGIITGYYNVNAHELRRQGIEDELSGHSGIEVVGSVENHDSGDEAYTAAKDFITANPDLTGLIVTAGGPQGAAKAIEELGLEDTISLVCFDTTDEIVGYVKKGVIKGTVTQDPFGQGCDPIVLAYNQVISGEAAVTGKAYTKMDVYTPDNIAEAFPD
ncbi:MAG TPA: hypothetical protein DF613_05905 [Lachnospiraceae bacterium]|nr:hypothetical protein [Lachnospiraceae bacterium]